jgi:hypothetical protein
MRVHDDRYHRERLRFHVALRFIRLEARTHTIRHWTGLTDDRIRKLYRSYLVDSTEHALPRHRGKSPERVAMFLRSARLREQAALLASLFRMLGLLPPRASGCDTAPPSLRRAELLCQAYEVYRSHLPDSALSFEHAVFLLAALTRSDELTCGACRDCTAIVVIDRWALRSARCTLCASVAGDRLASDRAPARRLAAGAAALQDFGGDGPSSEHTSPQRTPATPQ